MSAFAGKADIEPATKAQAILIELKIFARILCCLIEPLGWGGRCRDVSIFSLGRLEDGILG